MNKYLSAKFVFARQSVKSFKKIFSLLNDREGAAMVEFAAVLPLVMISFMGLIEFGFIMNEWRSVNNLVQAQVLYVAASSASSVSNAQQIMASTASAATNIKSAVAEINSRILAANATPNVTLGCGCPTGAGASSAITLSRAFNATPPYCPPPPDASCGSGLNWSAYADVGATKQHVGFFSNLGWAPLLSAHAMVRIY